MSSQVPHDGQGGNPERGSDQPGTRSNWPCEFSEGHLLPSMGTAARS
ncbi:hypothetical protein [Brachybacterium sacelli]